MARGLTSDKIADSRIRPLRAMHGVNLYLLQLAARKEAASRVEFGDQSRKAAHDIPANKPSVEGV